MDGEDNERRRSRKELPLSIEAFLSPIPTEEAKRLRVLSSLCARTYFLRTLTPSSLWKRHGLVLVNTSLACEYPRSASEASASRDRQTIQSLEDESVRSGQEAVPFTRNADDTEGKPKEKWELGKAISTTGGAGSFANLAGPLASAAIAGGSAAAATIATVMGAVSQAYFTREGKRTRKDKDKNMLPPCPVEWFVCDDEEDNVRFLVIQGSDSLASWRSNLSFDPVPFEDKELGVRVHRGTYEAALSLYSRMVPIARSFLQGGSRRKIQLTGHSLGGSIATLLMIMMVSRGDIPPESFLPVVTFGSAAVFCDGMCNCGISLEDGGLTCSMELEGSTLLERFGFKNNKVVNVMMHRDIVPRAFSCDYALVAQFLQNVNQSFREHNCLRADKQVLYKPIGETIVLQPQEGRRWADHPLLPRGPGLYRLSPATTKSWMAAGIGAPGLQCSEDGRWYGMPLNADEAHFALLNNPHPLETLADAGAYGPEGSISLHHNPDHYTRAIGHVVKARKMTFASFLAGIRQKASALDATVSNQKSLEAPVESLLGTILNSPISQAGLRSWRITRLSLPLEGEQYSP